MLAHALDLDLHVDDKGRKARIGALLSQRVRLSRNLLAEKIDALAGSTQQLLDRDGKPMVGDLRRAIAAAEASLSRIDKLTEAA